MFTSDRQNHCYRVFGIINLNRSERILFEADTVFWDFDGVIKDSANIKIQAYVDMFSKYGEDTREKVISFYKSSGGLSRLELIPALYEEICKRQLSYMEKNKKCLDYSRLVFCKVLESPYIKGVKEYLSNNFTRQTFVIITNTPEFEIKKILLFLGIKNFFFEVNGSPKKKESVIRDFLLKHHKKSHRCAVIGDSHCDFLAASQNNVPFIFRGDTGVIKHENYILDFQNFR